MVAGKEDQLQELMIRKFLSILSPIDCKALCYLNILNYMADNVKLPETINEARSFEFDYGNGLKSEHFAIPCFLNAMFLYIEKVSNSGTHFKIVFPRNSKLFKSSTTKQLSQLDQNKKEAVQSLIRHFSGV